MDTPYKPLSEAQKRRISEAVDIANEEIAKSPSECVRNVLSGPGKVKLLTVSKATRAGGITTIEMKSGRLRRFQTIPSGLILLGAGRSIAKQIVMNLYQKIEDEIPRSNTYDLKHGEDG